MSENQTQALLVGGTRDGLVVPETTLGMTITVPSLSPRTRKVRPGLETYYALPVFDDEGRRIYKHIYSDWVYEGVGA